MSILACCEEIPKERERSLSRQNSVLDFFNSSSGFHASQPVPLYIGNEGPVDPQFCLLGFSLVIVYSLQIFLKYIFSIGQNKFSEATLLILTLRLWKICLDLTLLGSEPTTTSF